MDSNITIIGAGVVGLALAARLSDEHPDVFVVEKHRKFGQETSSRNSEVIHSGVYYPNGSLKARLCVEGREMLYRYCTEHGVITKRCGKIIVASGQGEVYQLEAILRAARQNGVTDSRIIRQNEIRELEPHIRAHCGLLFPSTGIIDSYGLMKTLENDSYHNRVNFVYGVEVIGIAKVPGGYVITITDADHKPFTFTSRYVINSAGLYAHQVAAMVGITDEEYRVYYWKGEYFSVGNNKHKLVNHLIYPVPEPNAVGLGIHATVTLDGRLRLGPNTIYLQDSTPEYSVDPSHGDQFYRSVKEILPFLEREDLFPDQAGVRPKRQKPGDPVCDFLIREESDRGLPRFINLIGIESPGLTACLSIAEYVSGLM